jgi:hypothetical protein
VEAARERFDRGREVEGKRFQLDHMTLGHHDPFGQAAVTLDADVHVIGASVLQAQRARGASSAPHVRLYADRGPVLERAGHLVTGDPRHGCSEARQPPVGRADRRRDDANRDLTRSGLRRRDVDRRDTSRGLDPHGSHANELGRRSAHVHL